MNNNKKLVALLLTLMLVLFCGMPCVSAAQYAPVEVQAYRIDTSSTAWLTLLDVGGTAYITSKDASALTDMESPKSMAQWKRFLDYELEHLPCRGYLRLREFRKKFPREVKAYETKAKELAAIPDLKKVADFIEFAKKAKDPPVFGPKDLAKKTKYEKLVNDMVGKGEAFKSHPDPRIAQEAKNAIADLKWTQATF